MAGKIPVGSLITDIKLNGDQPVKTLRQLRQAVSSTTSAWKAQEAVLKSAGKTTEAAEAKYKGLSEAVKAQRKVIDTLVEKQKSLKKQQEEIDTSTDKGKKAYESISTAIQKNAATTLKATSRLESLTKQQDRAKSSLNYYKSGLADAQKTLKQTQAVTKSYVDRLKAEGKGYESTKARLSGYRSSLQNLTKQQKIQEQELSRIASETGKSSSAYKRQQVRVNETATSIAKLNTKVKSTQKEVNRLSPNGFNRIANGAKRVTTAADKMKSGLKGAWEHVKTGATAAAAGIGAVGAAAVSGAKKAGDLEQSYREITNLAVTGGEKQKEAIKNVSEMQRQGRSMSIQYGKSQQSIAEAFEELVKRGYSTKQALGAMRTELQGSVASGDDFKDVVAVSSTTLESFGMRANTTAKMTANTKRAVNELAYAADMTSTGFKDLGYGMSYVGSSAHSAGFSLSETASAMGILSNNGLEASKAGTGLNEVINRLSVATGNLLKGDKKNALAKLGIKPKEITDSTGKLKDLSTVFGVINKHMQGMSKVQKINIMKSLFGMTGEQAGLILAKYNKQLGTLSKQTLKAGKDGDYVAKLSAKNSQTAKMQMARLKEAGDAFTMTLGAKMLPAINKAGDELVVFLTKSKDGKRLTNDFASGVEALSNGLVKMIEWIAHHQTETKLIAAGFGAAYGAVKLAGMVQWLNKTRLAFSGLKVGTHLINGFKHLGSAAKISGKLIKATGKGIAFTGKTMGKSFVKQLGLIGKGIKGLRSIALKAVKGIGVQFASAGKFLGSEISKGFKVSAKIGKGLFTQKGGAGIFNGALQSAKSAGGFNNLTAAGKVGTAAAGVGVAVDAATSIVKGIKDKVGSRKQYEDIGTGAGKAIGGGIGLYFGGPLGAAVGAKIGGVVGKWAGGAAKKFQNGWNKNKPPKKFWSLENMGYSAHKMWRGFTKGVTNTIKWFKKNWKEVGLYFVSPLAGAINSLYKHNPKFRKWVKNLVKSFKNAWKGIGKWFGNIGKPIQRSWKGMTHWFSNLGKNMAKGLKSAWKGMSHWFSNIAKGVRKAWHSMASWFTKLGSAMSKGLKATWRTVTKWFSGIAHGVQRAWSGMSHFFGRVGSASVRLFKSAWHGITSWFGGIIRGIKKAWDDFFGGISSTVKFIGKLLGGKVKVGNVHLAEGTDWKKKYGYPAVLNDGSDSPATGNREGILNPDGSVEVQQGVNVPRWIFPWQDVINAHDMAKLFGHSVHLANGTVDLRSLETNNPAKILTTLTKLTKKKYDEDRVRHEKQKERHDKNDSATASERKRLIKHEQDDKADRAKVAKAIRDALKKGRNTKGLIAQLNKLTSRINQDRKAVAKTNPHHGETLVDEGLLLGANSRIGKSKWISDALFKKLTTVPKTKKTKKHKSTRRRSTSTSIRSYSSSSSRVSVPSVSVSSASLKGLSSKSISVTAKVKGSKQIKALEKAMKRIKGGTHKVTVKTKGAKSVKSLSKAIKKIKGKKSVVSVKTKGTHELRSLHKSIDTTEKRLNVLAKTAKKDKFGEQISRQAEKAVKSLEGKGNFTKKISSMSKATAKDFKTMTSNVGKETDKIRKSTEQDFSNLYKRSYQSVKRLHNGVIKLGTATARGFGGAMKKMIGYASDSMRGTIRQINRGIRGIDAVLKQFGGNSSVINPVHFAKGTDVNGRLTHDTLAVVNDAQAGPRQEAVVTDQNDIIIPHGNNRKMLLRKGWGVLNGTQTQSLSLPHFANGTGISKKELRKLAENSLKHFAESFKNMFTQNLHDVGSDLTQGATDLSKRSGTHYGNPWSQAMWTVINKAIGTGGGSRAAFLRYAKETFDGVKYQMGAASKILSDCSGMVMQALRHFGINIGRTTVDMANSAGTKYLGKNLSKTEPGDLVIFGHGTGAAGHVGIINNPAKGTMFNETPPYARISKISDAMSMGYGYYRVKGLHDQSKHQPKIKPSLLALAKRELGGKALNWIGDHLSENESAVAGKPTGDHAHWMKQAHIPERDWADINYIVSAESGWNPHIVNPSSGTYGLGQMQGYNLHYYTKHGAKGNAIAQLMGIMDYIHDRYGTVANAVRFRKAHNWYANGGIASSPSIFGEAGPEMAVPLIPSKSTRAWELIGKAVGILTANSNLSANQQRVETKDEKDEHDLLKAMLLVLQKISVQSHDVHITLETPEGRKLWEVVEPFYKQDRRQDMIKERRGLSARFR